MAHKQIYGKVYQLNFRPLQWRPGALSLSVFAACRDWLHAGTSLRVHSSFDRYCRQICKAEARAKCGVKCNWSDGEWNLSYEFIFFRRVCNLFLFLQWNIADFLYQNRAKILENLTPDVSVFPDFPGVSEIPQFDRLWLGIYQRLGRLKLFKQNTCASNLNFICVQGNCALMRDLQFANLLAKHCFPQFLHIP